MSQPTLSVIIPTYNRSSFLAEAIASAKRQGLEAVEILVVDDGSNPEEEAKIKSIAEHAGAKLIRQEINYGVSAARNLGVQTSSGQYIILLDDDDWLADGFAAKAIGLFHSGDKVVMAKASLYGDEKRKKYYNFLQSRYHHQGIDAYGYFLVYCPAIHCVVWKRSCFDDIRFDETLTYGEDRELFLRLRKNAVQMRSVDLLGGYYRVSPEKKGRSASFVDYILRDKLYHISRERSYAYILKGYLLLEQGLWLKGLGQLTNSLAHPQILLQQFVLFFRFKLFR